LHRHSAAKDDDVGAVLIPCPTGAWPHGGSVPSGDQFEDDTPFPQEFVEELQATMDATANLDSQL